MIRAATPDDVIALLALEERVFGVDAWTRRLLQDAVPDTAVLAGVDGVEGLAGHAVVTVAGDVADLQRIAVQPELRRRGLARELLTHATRTARAGGAGRMLLEVREDNAGARGFYEAAGFTAIDVRRRYYRDGTDAIVLALET